jgi:hypothetical protein
MNNNFLNRKNMKNYIISKLSKRICKFLVILFPLFLLGLVTTCDDMNSIHQKYYDRGMTIYTGAVDSLRVFPGFERVRLAWQLTADPRVTRTIIYWNQRADSVVVPVNRTQSGIIPMSYYIPNMPERDYVFELITRDNYGHFSMPQEVVTTVFGEVHRGALRNRSVASIMRQPEGTIITWDPIASQDVQYVTVSYEINGEQISVRVENGDIQTILTGLNAGDRISVATTYLHENALDPMTSRPVSYVIPVFEREINPANFSTVILAGDNTTVNNNRPLSNLWTLTATNNPNILHTVSGQPYPNHFTFDMGVPANISRFRLWSRTDNSPFTGNNPRTFELWGTNDLKADPNDAAYWAAGGPWQNDWVLLGDHEINNQGGADAWQAGEEFQVDEDCRVRYIRLIIKSVWNMSADGGLPAISIGRIVLWGDDL